MEIWRRGRWAWNICRKVWRREVWPKEWKEGIVVPISKKGKVDIIY